MKLVIGTSAVAFGALATLAFAQASIFPNLIGQWNHLGSGESLDVRSTGDVWLSNGPMSRVSRATEAGGNFAVEGRGQNGPYRCVYYITFLEGAQRANWRLSAAHGEIDCPQGMFARVARVQNGR